MSIYVAGCVSGVAIAISCHERMVPADVALALGSLGSVLLQGRPFDCRKNRYLRRSGSRCREGDDLEETGAELRAHLAGGAPAWRVLLERRGHTPWLERHARGAFYEVIEGAADPA